VVDPLQEGPSFSFTAPGLFTASQASDVLPSVLSASDFTDEFTPSVPSPPQKTVADGAFGTTGGPTKDEIGDHTIGSAMLGDESLLPFTEGAISPDGPATSDHLDLATTHAFLPTPIAAGLEQDGLGLASPDDVSALANLPEVGFSTSPTMQSQCIVTTEQETSRTLPGLGRRMISPIRGDSSMKAACEVRTPVSHHREKLFTPTAASRRVRRRVGGTETASGHYGTLLAPRSSPSSTVYLPGRRRAERKAGRSTLPSLGNDSASDNTVTLCADAPLRWAERRWRRQVRSRTNDDTDKEYRAPSNASPRASAVCTRSMTAQAVARSHAHGNGLPSPAPLGLALETATALQQDLPRPATSLSSPDGECDVIIVIEGSPSPQIPLSPPSPRPPTTPITPSCSLERQHSLDKPESSTGLPSTQPLPQGVPAVTSVQLPRLDETGASGELPPATSLAPAATSPDGSTGLGPVLASISLLTVPATCSSALPQPRAEVVVTASSTQEFPVQPLSTTPRTTDAPPTAVATTCEAALPLHNCYSRTSCAPRPTLPPRPRASLPSRALRGHCAGPNWIRSRARRKRRSSAASPPTTPTASETGSDHAAKCADKSSGKKGVSLACIVSYNVEAASPDASSESTVDEAVSTNKWSAEATPYSAPGAKRDSYPRAKPAATSAAGSAVCTALDVVAARAAATITPIATQPNVLPGCGRQLSLPLPATLPIGVFSSSSSYPLPDITGHRQRIPRTRQSTPVNHVRAVGRPHTPPETIAIDSCSACSVTSTSISSTSSDESTDTWSAARSSSTSKGKLQDGSRSSACQLGDREVRANGKEVAGRRRQRQRQRQQVRRGGEARAAAASTVNNSTVPGGASEGDCAIVILDGSESDIEDCSSAAHQALPASRPQVRCPTTLPAASIVDPLIQMASHKVTAVVSHQTMSRTVTN